MGNACSMNGGGGGEKWNAYRILVGNSEERDH
jgi:hypothetical protein